MTTITDRLPVIPYGMKPWFGGSCAPDDWDGVSAVDRRGIVGNYSRHSEAWRRRDCDLPDDIVGYSALTDDTKDWGDLHQIQHEVQPLVQPKLGGHIVRWVVDEIAALRNRLSTANQGAGEWRDIASAQRDPETIILAYWPSALQGQGTICTAIWSEKRQEFSPWPSPMRGVQFTHWLPLPASPTPPVRGGD